MTTTRKPRLATQVSQFHDRYDRLRDDLERKLLPHMDLSNTADAQIVELARDIVTCLRIRRIELTGYNPSEREDADAA